MSVAARARRLVSLTCASLHRLMHPQAVILYGVELAERYKGRLAVFSVHVCRFFPHSSIWAAHFKLPQPGGAVTNLGSSMTKEDYERFSEFYNPDGTPKGDWARSIGQGTAT
jgi:hypothetical protein